jgi:hypothetical protein
MTGKPALHVVKDAPEEAPDTSYEAEQRKRIMSRDWAAVHVSADRRAPFASITRLFR